MLFKPSCFSSVQRGFTLIEIIIGIVVFAIALTIITPLISPAEENSADQIHQIKAAELAQSLMNDIMNHSYDENSDRAGGVVRCNDEPYSCTDVDDLGVDAGEDENDRNTFDDVDDFNGFTLKTDAIGSNLSSQYNNFEVNVLVSYNGRAMNLPPSRAKQIIITVTTPLGTDVVFTAFRADF